MIIVSLGEYMQDYERLINQFFYQFNITIIDKLKEHKNTISPECYSVTYRLWHAAKSEDNGLVVRFSFNDNDNVLKAHISCSYANEALAALRFDGAVFKDELALGLKCIDFLDRQKINHSYGLIELSASIHKDSRKIVFGQITHSIKLYRHSCKTECVDLIVRVNHLVDIELENLEIETNGVFLNDKLDLLGMVVI